MTHICVSKIIIIGSDNGLSPGWRQAIIRTNARILLIGPLGINFSEILIEINIFSFKKMQLKILSAKWRLFSLGLNVLMEQFAYRPQQLVFSSYNLIDLYTVSHRTVRFESNNRCYGNTFINTLQRDDMETLPALLALCEGNPLVTKGQWRGALMFSLICTRISVWVNNGEAGDLRHHRAHYGVIVMISWKSGQVSADLIRHDVHVMSRR